MVRTIRWQDYTVADQQWCIPSWINGDQRWSYPLHDHEGQAEIMVVLEGTLSHQLNGNGQLMTMGDACLVAETDRHHLAARSGGLRLLNLAFPVVLLNVVAGIAGEEFGCLHQQIRLEPADLERLIDYATHFTTLARQGAVAGGRLLMLEFLLWFKRLSGPRNDQGFEITGSMEGEEAPELPPPWLTDLIGWAEIPGKTPPTMQALIERSGRTEAHLCRSFRRYCQTTPGTWLQGLRLRRARDLLAHSNWELAEICFASGFESIGRFYAVFRQIQGLPPGQYRASLNQHPYVAPSPRALSDGIPAVYSQRLF